MAPPKINTSMITELNNIKADDMPYKEFKIMIIKMINKQ